MSQLIRRFITFHTLRRPYITLKWAESSDRYIDYSRTDGKPVILSSPLTSMLVHKKRAEHSAILVGTRTAELDNPGLNVRHWYGRSPVRIVLDRQQKLSPSLHLFDGSVPTSFYRSPARSATECRISASQRLPAEYTPRNHGNAVYTRITIPFGRGWQPNAPNPSLMPDCGTKSLWKKLRTFFIPASKHPKSVTDIHLQQSILLAGVFALYGLKKQSIASFQGFFIEKKGILSINFI